MRHQQYSQASSNAKTIKDHRAMLAVPAAQRLESGLVSISESSICKTCSEHLVSKEASEFVPSAGSDRAPGYPKGKHS